MFWGVFFFQYVFYDYRVVHTLMLGFYELAMHCIVSVMPAAKTQDSSCFYSYQTISVVLLVRHCSRIGKIVRGFESHPSKMPVILFIKFLKVLSIYSATHIGVFG